MTDEPSKQEFAAVAPLPTSPVKVPGQGAPSTIVLSPEEQQAVTRMFGNPNYFPEAFKSWIVQYMALNSEQIPRSQIQGLGALVGRYAQVSTTEGTGSNPTDLATVGPTIEELQDGTYYVIGACETAVTAGGTSVLHVTVNGSATELIRTSPTVNNIYGPLVGFYQVTVSNNNNNTIKLQYGHVDTAGNSNFKNRRIFVLKT